MAVKSPPWPQCRGERCPKLLWGRSLLYSCRYAANVCWASAAETHQCCERHSRRTVALKLSMTALSVGFPGREKSSWTWFQYAQWSSAFEVNSVPLSTWITAASVRCRPTAASTRTTSSPRNVGAASRARHSRV